MHEKNLSGKSLKIAIDLYCLIPHQNGFASLVTSAFGMGKMGPFFLHHIAESWRLAFFGAEICQILRS